MLRVPVTVTNTSQNVKRLKRDGACQVWGRGAWTTFQALARDTDAFHLCGSAISHVASRFQGLSSTSWAKMARAGGWHTGESSGPGSEGARHFQLHRIGGSPVPVPAELQPWAQEEEEMVWWTAGPALPCPRSVWKKSLAIGVLALVWVGLGRGLAW